MKIFFWILLFTGVASASTTCGTGTIDFGDADDCLECECLDNEEYWEFMQECCDHLRDVTGIIGGDCRATNTEWSWSTECWYVDSCDIVGGSSPTYLPTCDTAVDYCG